MQESDTSTMLKIVVTFAVHAEFAPWRRMLHSAPVGDARVNVVMTGVGARSVQSRLREALQDADICIATGLAGALKKQHAPGAILVAKAVKSSETQQEVRSDPSLVQMAAESGAVAVDYFLTSNVVVNSPTEKLRIGTSADAVEMESFHVLNYAEHMGVPGVAVRAISDGAETEVPIDFNKVIDRYGEISRTATLREITKVPNRVPQLIRFGLESSRARRSLAHFLDVYVRTVSVALAEAR